MVTRHVDWILTVVTSTLPKGASLHTLPPFRGLNYKTGYASEEDADKRREQVERICRARWGAAPTLNIVKRERRVRRVVR